MRDLIYVVNNCYDMGKSVIDVSASFWRQYFLASCEIS